MLFFMFPPNISITLLLDNKYMEESLEFFENRSLDVVYYDNLLVELDSKKYPKRDFVIEVVDDPVSPAFRSQGRERASENY